MSKKISYTLLTLLFAFAVHTSQTLMTILFGLLSSFILLSTKKNVEKTK